MESLIPKLLVLVCVLLQCSHAEYFTSSGHMQFLFQTEKELASKLKEFIELEEKRLHDLKQFYSRLEYIEKLESQQDIQAYVGHPTNAFQMVRRLYNDWPNIKKLSNAVDDNVFLPVVDEYEHLFPTDADMKGAKEALLRLQDTFALTAHQMANGIVANPQNYTKLSAQDAYDIGRIAYLKARYDTTVDWMREALVLYENNEVTSSGDLPNKADILDHLAWSEYETNEVQEAYNHTIALLELDPYNERIQRNKVSFGKMLDELKKEKMATKEEGQQEEEEKEAAKKKDPKKSIADTFPRFFWTDEEDDWNRYLVERELWQKLCRGETKPIPKKFTKALVCWHKSDHPLLVLKPARVERFYPQPELIYFRQAMSDAEIERVQELATPMLRRATVHNPATGKLESAEYRTSKSAWLDESHDSLVQIMNNRIEAYTGLSMETAEKLQVANYGMGGHYETHFDFGRSVPLRPPPWKNRTDYTIRTHKENLNEIRRNHGHRIATVLFYMSNVEAGGSTVFTNIGQAVTPSKGDAVFWFNLHRDGSGDFDTRHAACPVLIGDKWVSNRWIHEGGQEFRRKCNLKPEDDSNQYNQ